MIYRFVIVCDEVEAFRRDIRIDSSATFLQLNDAIIESVGYDSSEMTRFVLTDKSWRPKQEILMMDMGVTHSDKELYLMESTYLDELLEDEGERLLFNFDMLGDRYFYMELREITLGDNLKKAEVVRSKGDAPVQISDVEELLSSTVTKKALGAKEVAGKVEEDDPTAEFDSDSFDMEDIDTEGFELSEGDPIEE
ncbi:hypothetical protein QYZ87_01470 [Porphyromonadaceae bacterium W3.11]|nr:hypothetical protein [Porphyromonadaceae bacterium W3.11]